jgi:Spy/CpxP family protein refolding chaperone
MEGFCFLQGRGAIYWRNPAMTKVFLSSLVALALISPALFAADDDKGAAKKAATKADAKSDAKTDAKADAGEGALKGRLPANYSKIVDATQRQKIYAIQANYVEKLEDLKKQLIDLEAKRDAEIRGVLTEKQQKQLDELTGDTSKAKGKKASKDVAKDAKE